ncbi:MAG TPA: hypothetical protein VEJ16_15720 [Alphaproteobacteria bacterium]|jgi:hypothetical protein|nr:hypothetical protein [Alphaproteobacteria bacterium]
MTAISVRVNLRRKHAGAYHPVARVYDFAHVPKVGDVIEVEDTDQAVRAIVVVISETPSHDHSTHYTVMAEEVGV